MRSEFFIDSCNENIFIEIPNNASVVGIRMSGGADTSLLAYMLSEHIMRFSLNVKLLPITIVQIGKSYQEIYAKQVIKFIENKFGNIFLDHYVDISTIEKTDYIKQQNLATQYLYSNKKIDCHFSGLTLNPVPEGIPSEIYSAGHYEPPDRIRTGIKRPIQDGRRYTPFINIDKRGISELYNKLGIIDTLFPLTRSCESYTEDFSKHCKKCWHCAERFYGFGRYE